MLQKEVPEYGRKLIQEVEMLICDIEALPCLYVDRGKSLRAQVFWTVGCLTTTRGQQRQEKLTGYIVPLRLLADVVPGKAKQHLFQVFMPLGAYLRASA